MARAWVINEIDHAPMAPVEWRVEGVPGIDTKKLGAATKGKIFGISHKRSTYVLGAC